MNHDSLSSAQSARNSTPGRAKNTRLLPPPLAQLLWQDWYLAGRGRPLAFLSASLLPTAVAKCQLNMAKKSRSPPSRQPSLTEHRLYLRHDRLRLLGVQLLQPQHTCMVGIPGQEQSVHCSRTAEAIVPTQKSAKSRGSLGENPIATVPTTGSKATL